MNIYKHVFLLGLMLSPFWVFSQGTVSDVSSWYLLGIVFMIIAGFIIGLGAVTVIDIHGFLGQKSSYWTQATTRTHKVTKPLIWIGTFLVIMGLLLYGGYVGFSTPIVILLGIFFVLVCNGLFLTFGVSRFLLERERQGRDSDLLPKKWQKKIIVSFIISFLGWWSAVLLCLYVIIV
jgi:hypothetical protein